MLIKINLRHCICCITVRFCLVAGCQWPAYYGLRLLLSTFPRYWWLSKNVIVLTFCEITNSHPYYTASVSRYLVKNIDIYPFYNLSCFHPLECTTNLWLRPTWSISISTDMKLHYHDRFFSCVAQANCYYHFVFHWGHQSKISPRALTFSAVYDKTQNCCQSLNVRDYLLNV